jgi:hypothetical protein
MAKGEAIMAVVNKPLRRRRRTTQRGKSMSQSQRWGKVVTTMPVPEGNISTSAVWSEEVIEEAIVEADAEEATEEYVEGTDDLSELS